MIRIWDTVRRKSDGIELLVSSVYYDRIGMDAVPTHFICKWHVGRDLHMATLAADEVEPIA